MELTIISTSERRNHHVLKIFPGFCQNEYAQRAVNLPVVRSYSYPFSLRMSSMNIKNCYSCFRSSNYGWTWPICIPPVPNNKSALNIRTQIGPKGPYLPFLFFCGFGTKQQSRWPGQPKIAPGEWTHRMNKKPASSIYVTYVHTASARRRQARMADGLRHHTKLLPSLTKGMARAARPCQREAAAKASEVMWWRVGRVQMQHHWHGGAVCVVDYWSMLTRVRCVLFCFVANVPGSRVAWGSWATRAHQTARPTHTLYIAPR